MGLQFDIKWKGMRKLVSSFNSSMEYDFRKSSVSSYDSSLNRASTAAHPSMYPKISGSGSHSRNSIRNPPYHHAPAPPSTADVVASNGDVPRSNFHFDFEYERNAIAESTKEKPNWSRLWGLENGPQKPPESPYMAGPANDPVVIKYIASGLNREAIPHAVANYGDNPTRVKEFCEGYSILREMGFSPNSIAEALLMYDNDADKALTHCLSNAS